MNFEKCTPYFKSFGLSFLAASCLLSLGSISSTLASDHVDSPSVTVAGPTYTDPLKAAPDVASGKPEDITDVYAFREQDQTGNVADANRMVLVLTTNGLVPPGQARPFATDVSYQIKVARDISANGANLESSAKVLNFRFGVPDSTGIQKVYLNGNNIGNTTAYNATPNVINTTYNGQPIKVFTGETDDPFFLDFRIANEGLAFGVNGAGSANATRTPGDSFGNSNVNAIVVSAPMSAFQVALESKFYIWGATYK